MSIEFDLPDHRIMELGCQANSTHRQVLDAINQQKYAVAAAKALWALAILDELRAAAPEEWRKKWAKAIAEGGETQKP